MPITFIVAGESIAREQYDLAMRVLGREDVNAPNPPGFIAHLSGPTATGWQVVDV